MTRFDGRFARHRVQHVIQQIATTHLAVVLHELLGEVFDDLDQIAARNQCRMRHQQDRGATKLLQLKPNLFEQFQRLQ